ncbi:MAG: hypothetical protein QM781_19665 [Chitinophagaceae bacterium]
MEKIFSAAEKLAESLRQYADTRIESVKLSVAEKSSAAIANLAAAFFVAMILAFFFLFARHSCSTGTCSRGRQPLAGLSVGGRSVAAYWLLCLEWPAKTYSLTDNECNAPAFF